MSYNLPRSSRLALAALLFVTSVTRLGAQGGATPKVPAESLAARLARAEEAIAQLKQQVADQSTASAKSSSGLSLMFRGQVMVNAFSNSRRVNNVDVPVFARPDTANGLPQGGAGMAIRQTTLGIVTTAPNVLGATFTGDMDVDFYGGQQPSSGGRTFPLLRMRIARAALRWSTADVMIGQDAPLISQLNPVSVASVGVPGFTAAGNLWLWLPQVRVGFHTTGDVRLGVQGAILAPTSGDAAGVFDTDNDIAERAKRPYVEGRMHISWGSDEMAGEIGVSRHGGWFATPNSPLLRTSDATAVDAKIPFSDWFEVRGEWYDGEGMRGLGGGAVGQLFDTSDNPIHSMGMWAQANLKPTTRLTLGAGFGIDDPDDAGLPAGARLKNAATEAHLHLRPAGPMLVGLEWRRIETTYAAGKVANDHLNLAIGFSF